MKNDLVVMDNNLIRASYKLTANEMRLVLCALAQIPKDAEVDPGKAYYITKEDFVKLGVEPKNVAREIRGMFGAIKSYCCGRHSYGEIEIPLAAQRLTF